MGEVVRFKSPEPTFVTESTFNRAMAKIARLEAKVVKLRANNKALIKALRDPYNKNVKLQNARLVLINARLSDDLCCIPARSHLFCP